MFTLERGYPEALRVHRPGPGSPAGRLRLSPPRVEALRTLHKAGGAGQQVRGTFGKVRHRSGSEVRFKKNAK